jgi:hypothetical protein
MVANKQKQAKTTEIQVVQKSVVPLRSSIFYCKNHENRPF